MVVLVSDRDETAKQGTIDESLGHEREAQVETRQLLADLKDKEVIALEMIAILRGVGGPAARHDRKAARKALAKAKQRRILAEQSLRRSQNRLKGLEEQSADVNHAVIPLPWAGISPRTSDTPPAQNQSASRDPA